jgi:putative heme-binding domain-containing protein
MFGTGTDIAPDLTGSDRANLEYLLSNVVDPDGEVGNQYLSTLVTLKDGRLLLGMITDRTEQSLTIRNENETVIVNMSEVAVIDGEPAIQQSQNSLMAEGLLTPLSNEEIRDLAGYMASPVQVPIVAALENLALFFDGESLANWEADPAIWSVEDGELVGRTTTGLPNNVFARSQMLFDDFRLIVQVKLVGNQGNSGIQFRSEAHGQVEMRGYQADIGVDWWGKLYEENGRELLFEAPGDSHVREGEWNTYEILAIGDRIQTSINGELCVDLVDPDGAARGMIGLQVHSGDPTEVRFRDFQLELDPEPGLRTTPSSSGGWPALVLFVVLGGFCVLLLRRKA